MRSERLARLADFLLVSSVAATGRARIAGARGGTLTGIVREDSSKHPLAGAEVAIDSLKRQVITDENGRYALTALPTGTHVVTVRRLGYRGVGAPVQVFAGQAEERDFALPRAPADPNARDMRHDWDGTFDITTITLSNILAVEVYKRGGNVPMDFQRDGTECGLVKIWTRR